MSTAVALPSQPGQRSARWPCACLGWDTVCALADGALTYRQLHYWTQGGIVPAVRHRQPDGAHLTGTEHGSGTSYGWEPADAARIATTAQLVRASGMRPEVAWLLARDGHVPVAGRTLRLQG